MQWVILNYYVSELRTYLFILKRVLHGVLWRKEEDAVILRHSAQRKHAFLGEIKQMSNTNKIALGKKIALELLHHGLGNRYIRLLMAGDNSNVCQDI